MSLIPFVGAAQKFNKSPDQYRIERSLRFRSSASAYLDRTPASTTNQKTWTWSAWVKRGQLSSSSTLTLFGSVNPGVSQTTISFSNDSFSVSSSGSGFASINLVTSAVYRDPSAWYHILVAVDTTQATDTNRVKIYVNGVQESSFSASTYPTQNTDCTLNVSGLAVNIGRFNLSGNFQYFDGYLTEINFVDGQALTPSSFGEFNTKTGVWQPKKYNGTYGTNGFYLNFSDNSSLSNLTADKSGNNNNWTPNNISLISGATFDSMIDVPTPYADGGNGRGNYAVMNPIRTSSAILTNGNLQVAQNTTAYVSSSSTMGMSSGKWYWEVTIVSASSQVLSLGITNSTSVNGITSGIWTYHLDGTKYIGASNSAYGSNYNTNGVVVGFAFDADAGTLTCYRNNVSQGTLVSGLAADTYFAYATLYNSGTVAFNFGQRPFAYTPPTGFKALNTQNLPEPVIAKGGEYFNTVLYTGNGTSQSVSGVGFRPDFTWLKVRSTADNHKLTDAVRGATKTLFSNTTDNEFTEANAVTSFDSDGFSLGSDSGNNGSGRTFVAWNWRGSDSAPVTNTDGSITSTVSANPTAGFSIVTWTTNSSSGNATIGHGLGVQPKFIIMKSRNATYNWDIYAGAIPNAKDGRLVFTTAAFSTANVPFGNTDPTSSVFTMSQSFYGTGINCVAYCFAEVPGYSRFGSYTGNGSADGPMVFTGFRPAFVMIKRTDTTENWYVHDTSRSPHNASAARLIPNTSAAEASDQAIDFVSNGFKLRTSDGAINSSGGTYIFAAFSEAAFKYALAR